MHGPPTCGIVSGAVQRPILKFPPPKNRNCAHRGWRYRGDEVLTHQATGVGTQRPMTVRITAPANLAAWSTWEFPELRTPATSAWATTAPAAGERTQRRRPG